MLYTWFNYEITIYTLVKLGMIDLSEEILIGNTTPSMKINAAVHVVRSIRDIPVKTGPMMT